MIVAKQSDSFVETEFGAMPSDWDLSTIGSLGRVVTGSTPSTKQQKYYGGCFKFVSPSDLNSYRYVRTSEKSLTREGLSVSRILPTKSVLVSCIGNIGKTGLTVDEECATNQQLNAIVCRDGLESEFVYYLMTFLGPFIASRGQKTTVPIISKGVFEGLPIPLPPLAEQRRSAAVLNTIQDAIAAQEDVIAAAKEFKRSLMQRLFTYGPGRKPAATKETLFGDVPKHWSIVALDKCAYVQTGLAKGRRFSAKDKTIRLPYIRVANVQDGYLDLSEVKTVEIREDELERYRLQLGDMLMTEGGDFDKLGRGFLWNEEVKDCLHQNHVFAVRADRKQLIPEFLAYLAQSSYGKAYFLSVAHRTTNLASINSTKLKAFPIPLPMFAEQQAIVDSVQAVDARIAAEEDRKTALEALFKSMLHQLMTGQIRLLSDDGLDHLLATES